MALCLRNEDCPFLISRAESLKFQRRLGLEVLSNVGAIRAEKGHADVQSEPLGARGRRLGFEYEMSPIDSCAEHLATSLRCCYFRNQWKL